MYAHFICGITLQGRYNKHNIYENTIADAFLRLLFPVPCDGYTSLEREACHLFLSVIILIYCSPHLSD